MAKKAALRDTLARLISELVDDVLVAAAETFRSRAAPRPAKPARRSMAPARRAAKAPRKSVSPRAAPDRGASVGVRAARPRAARPRAAPGGASGSVTNPELLLAALDGTAPSGLSNRPQSEPPRARRQSTPPAVEAPLAPAPMPTLRANEVSMVTRGGVVIRRARRDGP